MPCKRRRGDNSAIEPERAEVSISGREGLWPASKGTDQLRTDLPTLVRVVRMEILFYTQFEGLLTDFDVPLFLLLLTDNGNGIS